MNLIRPLCVASLLLVFSPLGWNALRVSAQAPPASPPAKEDPVSKLTPEDIATGKQIFAAQCAGCHGFDGSGQLGPNLHGVEDRRGDAGIFSVVRNGTGAMPPVMSLNDQRVWQVVGYVRTLGESAPVEPAKGDPAKGKDVYAANDCAVCHAINGVGGGVGPQLTMVGKSRPPKYFYDFLKDPGKNPPADPTLVDRVGGPGYLLVHVVSKDGKTDMTGIRVNEDTFTIVLRDVGGHFYTFDKAHLKTIEPEPGKSVMPSYGNLSATDMDNLVAYLSSLRGAQ
jgi:cytochrome c oxidase cbb3-type subunit III